MRIHAYHLDISIHPLVLLLTAALLKRLPARSIQSGSRELADYYPLGILSGIPNAYIFSINSYRACFLSLLSHPFTRDPFLHNGERGVIIRSVCQSPALSGRRGHFPRYMCAPSASSASLSEAGVEEGSHFIWFVSLCPLGIALRRAFDLLQGIGLNSVQGGKYGGSHPCNCTLLNPCRTSVTIPPPYVFEAIHSYYAFCE